MDLKKHLMAQYTVTVTVKSDTVMTLGYSEVSDQDLITVNVSLLCTFMSHHILGYNEGCCCCCCCGDVAITDFYCC